MSEHKPCSRFHQPIARARAAAAAARSAEVRAEEGRRAAVGARSNHDIPLIPFIDFLLCIVLFLLASFSASGELPIDKNVKLPNAENVIDMIEAPMVAITGTQILVDGTPAGSTRAIEEANRLQRIDELFNMLKNKRELWKQLNPGKEFPGVVVLQVDRKRPGAGREERVPDGGVRRLSRT